jgi:hypothetical protein
VSIFLTRKGFQLSAHFSATIFKRISLSHYGIKFLSQIFLTLSCRIREIEAHLNPAGKDGLLSLLHHVGPLPQGNQGPATVGRFINICVLVTTAEQSFKLYLLT